jgi:hypothetical protein
MDTDTAINFECSRLRYGASFVRCSSLGSFLVQLALQSALIGVHPCLTFVFLGSLYANHRGTRFPEDPKFTGWQEG